MLNPLASRHGRHQAHHERKSHGWWRDMVLLSRQGLTPSQKGYVPWLRFELGVLNIGYSMVDVVHVGGVWNICVTLTATSFWWLREPPTTAMDYNPLGAARLSDLGAYIGRLDPRVQAREATRIDGKQAGWQEDAGCLLLPQILYGSIRVVDIR